MNAVIDPFSLEPSVETLHTMRLLARCLPESRSREQAGRHSGRTSESQWIGVPSSL
jgi:hypothetical protein